MFDTLFSSPEVAAATDAGAWVDAMVDVEVALTRANAEVGVVPPAAADAIISACERGAVDSDRVWRDAVESATPVVGLVDMLRTAVPSDAAPYVHRGATSQDIVDTAMMLIARRSLALIGRDLATCAESLTELATQHAHTPQLARTLMQPARATTFGAVCAGWLRAVDGAHQALSRWRPALQLGGAVGDRAELGEHAATVAATLAASLGLDDVPPWHTDRTRVVELAAALGTTAGTLAKLATDVILLSQAEIGELSSGAGRSSAMPDKRNPARAVLVVACAHRVPAQVATLFAGMPQELQRAAGRWQAEWPTVTELLRATSGAASHTVAMLRELRVDPDRMGERA